MPVGRLTLAERVASVTAAIESPRAESARGSSWMRTAYFCAPNTETWATPATIEIRWARAFSAYSSSWESGSIGEVSARNRPGWSAGLTFWYEGGVIPVGSERWVLAIADWTSWAASSMVRSSENWSVMLVWPWMLDEVIASSPAIVVNCFSRGVATAEAMVSG